MIYTDLSHRSICSIVLGAIFDKKLGPSLRYYVGGVMTVNQPSLSKQTCVFTSYEH